VNLLHAVSKEEVRNSKNLHIVTRSGTGHDIHTPPQNYQRKKANNFPNPDKEEKIMREALKFFRNATKDQQNPRSRDEDTIQEFLQLLKEKQSIGRLLDLLNILREYKDGQKPTKDANHLSYNNKYYDPRVDLEIEGMMVNQVVVDFGSQVNILP
jgi:hypothetical protein